MQSPWHIHIENLKHGGFTGFQTIDDLRINNLASVPRKMGVYIVVRAESGDPDFLAESTGGHFKGKDPNVNREVLIKKWISGAHIVYIGKAGSLAGAATLNSRIKQYLDFGVGKNVGHWGGRYLWHLPASGRLFVAWKETPDEKPREVEKQLIAEFVQSHGAKPFANLVG